MTCFRGFSLIEILIVFILLAILSGLGLSFLPALLKKNQREVIADEISQAIQYAKLETLTRQRVLTLAPIADDADWSKGMRLYEDNKAHRYTKESTVIREWHWHSPGTRVTWRGFESAVYLRFTPELNPRSANGRFVLQCAGLSPITLVINRLAHVKRA